MRARAEAAAAALELRVMEAEMEAEMQEAFARSVAHEVPPRGPGAAQACVGSEPGSSAGGSSAGGSTGDRLLQPPQPLHPCHEEGGAPPPPQPCCAEHRDAPPAEDSSPCCAGRSSPPQPQQPPQPQPQSCSAGSCAPAEGAPPPHTHAPTHTPTHPHPCCAEQLQVCHPAALPLAEIEQATGGFGAAALIGRGGFAAVFQVCTPLHPSAPPLRICAPLRPSAPVRAASAPPLHHLCTTSAPGRRAAVAPVRRRLRGQAPRGERAQRRRALAAARRVEAPVHVRPRAASMQPPIHASPPPYSHTPATPRCHHEHLLPLLGSCLSPHSPCLVFPLVRGGNLEDRILRTPDALARLAQLGHAAPPPPLPWRARVQVLRDALSALVHLHTPSAGRPCTVHRDVCPANILVSAAPLVGCRLGAETAAEVGGDGRRQIWGYLADVGLARTLDVCCSRAQTSHVCGTLVETPSGGRASTCHRCVLGLALLAQGGAPRSVGAAM